MNLKMLELLAIFYSCIYMAITMDSIYSAVYTITYVVLILGIISVISIACRARGSSREPNIAMLNRKDNCSETAEKVPLDQGPCSAAADCKSALLIPVFRPHPFIIKQAGKTEETRCILVQT